MTLTAPPSAGLLPPGLGRARDDVLAAARGVVDRFDRGYYLDRVRAGRFPDEMWAAMAELGLAAQIFEHGGRAGYMANTAKLLASEAAVAACDVAIQTHGGSAFDRTVDVATIWPVARLLRIAPINNEMVLNFIGEHVLGLPRSY